MRAAAARDDWTGPTAGLALGYVQANLVILPRDWAYDFLLFCVRNPQPCPVLEVTDEGSPEPTVTAPGADLRTDVPRYVVHRHGEIVDMPTDLLGLWQPDFVSFLLGCSFSFEHALCSAGLPVRHIERGSNVPMYRTRRECRPAGRFRGTLVVSMRPMTSEQAQAAARITAQYPLAHGAPVHFGAPEELGIGDLARPVFGDPVPLQPGEIPVFWACGVTPQVALQNARPPLAITHAPGHMFVTDWPDERLRITTSNHA
ncbi:MAG TPA: putative hydro-lyase [Gemmatales bacterium]|nr:putative hydro-lyase [Gemmatales bacterium]